MKPKNRVMCPDCGRAKMLFKTEKEALTFIKFNGLEITDNVADLRVYYCPACCGYHITSKPYKESYDYRTDRLIKRYNNDVNTNQECDFVRSGEIFDQLLLKSFSTRKEVNDFLKTIKDVNTQTKDRARIKYYNLKKI